MRRHRDEGSGGAAGTAHRGSRNRTELRAVFQKRNGFKERDG